jgi:hypothetical protein
LLYVCSSFFLASNFCLFMYFFPYFFHCPILPSFFLITIAKCRPVPPYVCVSSVQYVTKCCHTHLTFIPVSPSSYNYSNIYIYTAIHFPSLFSVMLCNRTISHNYHKPLVTALSQGNWNRQTPKRPIMP